MRLGSLYARRVQTEDETRYRYFFRIVFNSDALNALLAGTSSPHANVKTSGRGAGADFKGFEAS